MAIVSGWKVDRGRTTEMDRTSAGTAVIDMIDTNHSVDPASGNGSPPGTPVALGLGGSPIFTGYVARWPYELYLDGTYGTCTPVCEDGLALLARTEMVADENLWGDPSANAIYAGNIRYDLDMQMKHRIDHILTQAGWPLGLREVFTGNVRLKPTTYAPGQSALAAIWDALEAEFPGIANGWITKDGKFAAHGRLARFNPTDPQYHITTWNCCDIPNWSAGKAVIFGMGPYGPDGDRIINQAFCTPEGIPESKISAQYVRDSFSIGVHGVRPWSAENLILDHSWLTGNTARVECKEVYAQYYIDNYSEAFNELRMLRFKWLPPGSPYADEVNALMSGIDISDRILLQTSNGFNEHFFVEGLHYTARPASNQYHEVTLDVDLSPATHWETLPT